MTAMTEEEWDAKLGIQTCGRVDNQKDLVHFPYEPTPYAVLERLSESGCFTKDDVLLDYGCGKCRVPVFMSSQTGCRSIGVEYDGSLYRLAEENCTASGIRNVSVVKADAEKYPVNHTVNRCFFFNPFGEQILRGVLDRISESCYECPRGIELFFYYPHEDHVALLMTKQELTFADEIDCADLFPGNNSRERILIFEISV